MYFNLSELDGRRTYKLMTSTVVPRPIAWVVSQDAGGRLNAAPFSFFGLMSGDPPLLCIGVGARDGKAKDTGANLRNGGEFVCNLVSCELLEAMNVTAIEFGQRSMNWRPPSCKPWPQSTWRPRESLSRPSLSSAA